VFVAAGCVAAIRATAAMLPQPMGHGSHWLRIAGTKTVSILATKR
jgi:hypothetical protein